MLYEGVQPTRNLPDPKLPKGIGARLRFVQFLENALGGIFIVPHTFPGERELYALFELANDMHTAGLIREMPHRGRDVSDEPRIFRWGVLHTEADSAGGMSHHAEFEALRAALAEAAERSLWFNADDFFVAPRRGRLSEMGVHAISPHSFAGFSQKDRDARLVLTLSPEQSYLWVQGYSWIRNHTVHIPAQIVSRKHFEAMRATKAEPIIRPIITTGLATGPTRTFALVHGALEVIERDAFMIMWLNQLSLPRIPSIQLTAQNPRLVSLIANCTRYRLTVHFVRLITDAPTHVICAVVEDGTQMPPITLGVSAHWNAGHAAEKALLEALRARTSVRHRLTEFPEVVFKNKSHLVHWERSIYWTNAERASKLSFLASGEEIPLEKAAWDTDTEESHWTRIQEWCARERYELASVSYTGAKKNVTPWHIEFVTIPELQPLYQHEGMRCTDGTRLTQVPRLFGCTPLKEPFIDEPHPFT